MATITLSDEAPKVEGKIGFSIANGYFDLASGDSFETEDAVVISGAMVNEWLKITFPAPPSQQAADYDPNDPHDNPAADHLGLLATPEVKQAAEVAEAAIQAEAYPQNPQAAAIEVTDEAEIKSDTPAPAPVAPEAAPVAPAPAVTSTPSTTGASS